MRRLLPAARWALTPPFHPFRSAIPKDFGEVVCFLWRYPWGRPRRALPAAMSKWSPDFPRPPCEGRDRPAVWSGRENGPHRTHGQLRATAGPNATDSHRPVDVVFLAIEAMLFRPRQMAVRAHEGAIFADDPSIGGEQPMRLPRADLAPGEFCANFATLVNIASQNFVLARMAQGLG